MQELKRKIMFPERKKTLVVGMHLFSTDDLSNETETRQILS